MQFSFKEYSDNINRIRKYLPIVRFDDVKPTSKKYCVIRHDVEFSIERALELAKVEHTLGVSSTYVFQICNNNYNPFSWTEQGLDNWNNFYILTKEKQQESLDSINEEIKTYPKNLYEEECNILGRR